MESKKIIMILSSIIACMIAMVILISAGLEYKSDLDKMNQTAFNAGAMAGARQLYSEELSSLNINGNINFPVNYINQTTGKTETTNIILIPQTVCQNYINQLQNK